MAERLRWIRRLVALWSLTWVVVRAPFLLDLADLPAHRWHPLGVLAPIDRPPSSAVAGLAIAATAILAVLVLLDRGPRQMVLPAWSVGVLLTTTWASSWGHLFHTEHLLAVHALILGVAALPRRVDPGFVVQAMAVATVTTYVVAGVAKLRGSGGEWLSGDVLREQVAFDNLRKAVIGSGTSPLGTRLVDTRWLWRPLALGSLIVELGAPIALVNRRWALVWVAAAWLFHLGVVLLMAIAFPYPLSLVAYAPLLPLEHVAAWGRARRRRPAGAPLAEAT
jgi:hypothetical protein